MKVFDGCGLSKTCISHETSFNNDGFRWAWAIQNLAFWLRDASKMKVLEGPELAKTAPKLAFRFRHLSKLDIFDFR
jgi:hypothetical protein